MHRVWRCIGAAVLALLVAGVLAQPAHAQFRRGTGKKPKDCASCHGKTGLGDGSLAEHLRTPPTDLTELSRRNGDVFPLELVTKIIDGRKSVKGHGGADMPAWGDAFAKSRGGLTEEEVRARIHNITHFLWSIQKAAG